MYLTSLTSTTGFGAVINKRYSVNTRWLIIHLFHLIPVNSFSFYSLFSVPFSFVLSLYTIELFMQEKDFAGREVPRIKKWKY